MMPRWTRLGFEVRDEFTLNPWDGSCFGSHPERDEEQKEGSKDLMEPIWKPVGMCNLWWNLILGISLHDSGSDLISLKKCQKDVREEGRKIWYYLQECWKASGMSEMLWNLCKTLESVSKLLKITLFICVTGHFFSLLSTWDNITPPQMRASWRNPDLCGQKAGTWWPDKAGVKSSSVRGQERPDVEAEKRQMNHLGPLSLHINFGEAGQWLTFLLASVSCFFCLSVIQVT